MISHEGKVYLLIKEATELTLFNDNAVLSNISVTTCIVISLDVKLILVQYRVYKTISLEGRHPVKTFETCLMKIKKVIMVCNDNGCSL